MSDARTGAEEYGNEHDRSFDRAFAEELETVLSGETDKERLLTFSAHLTGTVPRASEGFRRQLLHQLKADLYGNEDVASMVDAIGAGDGTRAYTGAPGRREEAPRAHVRAQDRHARKEWTARVSGPAMQKPRVFANAFVAIAVAALMLALFVGMASLLSMRQQSGRPSGMSTPSPQDTLKSVYSMQPLVTITGEGKLAWSPDGQTLDIGGSYGITKWDITTGSPVHSVKLLGDNGPVWSPDRRTAVYVHNHRTVKIVDTESGSEIVSWSVPEDVATLAFSPDGRTLATGASNSSGIARLWDVASAKEVTMINYGYSVNSAYAPGLAFSPDGAILAVGDWPTAATLWDARTGRLLQAIGADYQKSSLAALALTPSPTPAPTPAYRDMGGGGMPIVSWSPDGRYVATVYSRIVTVWDTSSGKQVRMIGAPVPYDDFSSVWDSLGWVSDVSWSPDGRVLAISNGTVTLWDAQTGQHLRDLIGPSQPPSRTADARQAEWSPDGSRVALALGGRVEVWGDPSSLPLVPTPAVNSSPDVTVTAVTTATAGALSCDAWSIMPSPNVGSVSVLRAVAAFGDNDVWAVGYSSEGSAGGHAGAGGTSTAPDSTDGHDGVARTLIEHWNGAQWSVVPSPNVGAKSNYLLGVAATSRYMAWAVGYYINDRGVEQTLVLQWDGAIWSVVPSPNLGTGHNRLRGVAAYSRVWAVGSYVAGADSSAPANSLTMYDDGYGWTIVPTPDLGQQENRLMSVSALWKEAWAVGSIGSGRPSPGGSGGPSLMLMHAQDAKDSQWSMVSGPGDGTGYGVAALPGGHVWVVGAATGGGTSSPVAGHWTGSDWDRGTGASNVPYPQGKAGDPTTYSALYSVTAFSPTKVWAAGTYSNTAAISSGPQSDRLWKTLIMRYSGGKSWEQIPSPNVQGQDNGLFGMSASPDGSLWAVGYYGPHEAHGTLVMRHGGPGCPTPEPGATATIIPLPVSTYPAPPVRSTVTMSSTHAAMPTPTRSGGKMP